MDPSTALPDAPKCGAEEKRRAAPVGMTGLGEKGGQMNAIRENGVPGEIKKEEPKSTVRSDCATGNRTQDPGTRLRRVWGNRRLG